MLLRYALSRLAIDFHKNPIGDDVIIMSLNFCCQLTILELNRCTYFNAVFAKLIALMQTS